MLRLVYAGLNFDDDAQIYIRNSILEVLLSFYASPLSDNESKELILLVVFNLIMTIHAPSPMYGYMLKSSISDFSYINK